MIATVVDWDALLQVIWVSLVAGVGVTAAWAFAIVGGTGSFARAQGAYAIEHRARHLGGDGSADFVIDLSA